MKEIAQNRFSTRMLWVLTAFVTLSIIILGIWLSWRPSLRLEYVGPSVHATSGMKGYTFRLVNRSFHAATYYGYGDHAQFRVEVVSKPATAWLFPRDASGRRCCLPSLAEMPARSSVDLFLPQEAVNNAATVKVSLAYYYSNAYVDRAVGYTLNAVQAMERMCGVKFVVSRPLAHAIYANRERVVWSDVFSVTPAPAVASLD